jgi:pSer/pThr/pTyr-binding forkhead associated (FHA) protein
MSRRKNGRPNDGPVAFLKPLNRRDASRLIRLGRPVCVIGSDSRVHLRLPSKGVSRVHALIFHDDGEYFVRDLASRNGTYLNGRPVREHRLVPRDVLCVGPYAFRWSGPGERRRQRKLINPPTGWRASLTVPDGQVPFEILDRTVLIGRRTDCDITLQAMMVDPLHSVLFARERKMFVRDLNSRGGTFVNGQRTRESELNDGDEIRIGLSFVRFACSRQELPQSQPASEGPAPEHRHSAATVQREPRPEFDFPALQTADAVLSRQRNLARRILLRLNDTAILSDVQMETATSN